MSPPNLRTYAYIDGFNLYYRCVKGTPHKWLDLRALVEGLLKPNNQLGRICYYTARVSGRSDPDSPKRQHAYLRALETIPGVSIYYGSFLAKEIERPLVNPVPGLSRYVNVHTTEEKGSDVNLASHLIRDGFSGAYDVAVVLSNDTDLVEPIRIVAQELGKPVGLISPVGSPSPKLTAVSTFARRITLARLASAQLPNPVTARNGKQIFKPSTW